MNVEQWTLDEMKELAQVYQGIAHPARIAILVAVKDDVDMQEVADFVDIRRPSLQDHIDKLVDAELIYRPEDTRSYQMTPVGQYFLSRLDHDHENLLKALETIHEAEDDLWEDRLPEKKDLEDYNVPIDEKELERQIHTQKWELEWDNIKDHLSETES